MDPLVSPQTNREGSSSSPSSELICDEDNLRLGSIVGATTGGSSSRTPKDCLFKISSSSRRMALTCFKVSVCLIVLGCLVHVVFPYGLTPRGSSSTPLSLRYSTGNGQVTNNGQQQANTESPKISVYLRDFAGKVVKEFTSLDGNSVELPEFKVEDHIWQGKSIVLECFSSSFPVLWEYKGVGNPKVRVDTYRESPEFSNPNSYTYGSRVVFSSTNYRQTGEFICKGAKEYSSSASKVFVFVPGTKLFVAKGEINDTVVVKVKDDEGPWVTLPCVVSNQEVTAKLFLHTKSGSFKHLELDPNSLTFDSRYGFRLKWKDNPAVDNPWGYYICQGELVKRSGDVGKVKYEKLFVKLEESNGNDSRKNFPESNLKFSFNEESHTLECCSTKPSNRLDDVLSLPKLFFHTCISMSDCHMTVSSMDVSCLEGKCPDDHSIHPINGTCTGYELPEMSEGGILDCFSGDDLSSKERLQFSYDTQTGLVTNFESDSVNTEQVLHVGREEVSLKDVKPGSHEAIYFCHPSSFFFSDGLKWAVERRDSLGTLEFVPEDGFPQRPSIKVDEEIVGRVHCYAPIWDSKTEWRNASITVPIPT